jgi:hypothetical protein
MAISIQFDIRLNLIGDGESKTFTLNLYDDPYPIGNVANWRRRLPDAVSVGEGAASAELSGSDAIITPNILLGKGSKLDVNLVLTFND